MKIGEKEGELKYETTLNEATAVQGSYNNPTLIVGANSKSVTLSLMAVSNKFYALMMWPAPGGDRFVHSKLIDFIDLVPHLRQIEYDHAEHQADPLYPENRYVLETGDDWKLEATLAEYLEVFLTVPRHGTVSVSVSHDLMRCALD